MRPNQSVEDDENAAAIDPEQYHITPKGTAAFTAILQHQRLGQYRCVCSLRCHSETKYDSAPRLLWPADEANIATAETKACISPHRGVVLVCDPIWARFLMARPYGLRFCINSPHCGG